MLNKYTVVASAFRANLGMNINLERHEIAMQWLINHNICDFKTVVGVYHEDGMPTPNREVSLVITDLSHDEVLKVGGFYLTDMAQDCVLVVNQSDNTAVLIGKDWDQYLGTYQKVTKEEAYKAGIYTLDTNGQYWLAK